LTAFHAKDDGRLIRLVAGIPDAVPGHAQSVQDQLDRMFTIERNPCSLAQTIRALSCHQIAQRRQRGFSSQSWHGGRQGSQADPPALPRRQPVEELAAIASTAAAAESERRSAISLPDPTALADLAQHRAPVGRIRLQCGYKRRSVSAEPAGYGAAQRHRQHPGAGATRYRLAPRSATGTER
jgi:hypothetical protein